MDTPQADDPLLQKILAPASAALAGRERRGEDAEEKSRRSCNAAPGLGI